MVVKLFRVKLDPFVLSLLCFAALFVTHWHFGKEQQNWPKGQILTGTLTTFSYFFKLLNHLSENAFCANMRLIKKGLDV